MTEAPFSSSNSHILDDPRTIAGIFRHAIITKSTLNILSGWGASDGVITQLIEDSARSRSKERRIVIELSSKLAKEGPVSCRLSTPEYLVTFVSELIIKDDRIEIAWPHQIEMISFREDIRCESNFLWTYISPFEVKRDTIGFLRIVDVSRSGFGVELIECTGPTPAVGSRIFSKVITEEGTIGIDGVLSWVKKNDESENYRAGVNIEVVRDIREQPNKINARAAMRVVVAWPVSLRSPINPNYKASLTIIDASSSGCRAKLLNPAEEILFPVGCELFTQDGGMRLRVIDRRDYEIRFEIIDATLIERIKWHKQLLIHTMKNVALDSPDTNDLLEVFTYSGSLNATLSEFQSKALHRFKEGLSKNISGTPWLIRANEINERGRIRGSVSAVLYGDSLWYVGALAGHSSRELRISDGFVSKYLNALSDFVNCQPEHTVMLFNWLASHPYWVAWDDYLKSVSKDIGIVRYNSPIIYLRDNRWLREKGSSHEVKITQITGKNIQSIFENHVKNSPPESRTLLARMGLNENSFGSRRLHDLFSACRAQFERKFQLIETQYGTYVVVISSYPFGTVANNIVNYPFVAKVSGNSITNLEGELSIVLPNIHQELIGMGVQANAVLTCGFGSVNSNNDKLSISDAVWTLGGAETLQYWRRDAS